MQNDEGRCMDGEVQFPLFAFEKDDSSMFRLETPDRILHRLEPIDIENGEYLFWNSKGRNVRVSVKGNMVGEVCYGEPRDQGGTGLLPRDAMTLDEAFKRHAEAFNLSVDTAGAAEEVWSRLKEAEARLPRRGLLSRLFKAGE